jgi:guanine deaminase
MSNPLTAIRGPVLTYTGDAFRDGLESTMSYERDAIIAMTDGRITHFGPANQVRAELPKDAAVKEYGADTLILAGFIDCHVHYPQTQIIGAYGGELIDWLNKYTFIAEQQFADPHARSRGGARVPPGMPASRHDLGRGLLHGTSAVGRRVLRGSPETRMRMIAGKVLMDRNAPEALTDTPQRGYDDSRALIGKWHGKGRLLYGVTPRFAASSTREQLEMAGALWNEHPGTYLQSHVSENRAEVSWVKELYPERSGYLDVYDHYRLLGPRSIYGHGIWLSEQELLRCHESGTAIAHCPTSNQFLGSGLFNIGNALNPARPVRVGLATDIGAGTSFSMLQTLNETYKVAQLNGHALSAGHAFYLATRGTAKALYLDKHIGSVAVGMEADVIVLDLKSTPLIDFRMRHCRDIHEVLFIQMTMGDDRAVLASYIAGQLAYQRPA